jgi:diadenylate cyclase
VLQIIEDLINNLVFIFERLDWLAVFDLILVTMIFTLILRWLRDTQALVLLRGVILLIALIGLLTSLEVLPAFSWLMRTTLPALLLVIPVIFAPEFAVGLGRAGAIRETTARLYSQDVQLAISQSSAPAHGSRPASRGADRLSAWIISGLHPDGRADGRPVTPAVIANVLSKYATPRWRRDRVGTAGGGFLCSTALLQRETIPSPERQMGCAIAPHWASVGERRWSS